MKNPTSKVLPSREIAYNYCAAMFMAQQMEDELRYILDSADYYGMIDEIELSKKENEKHRKSLVNFLDEATCGRLLQVLKNRISLPSEHHWQLLETAIKDRNFLAHKFLVQFDYEALTKKEEERAVHTIYDLFLRLWKAVQIVRALKKRLDEKTDRIDSSLDRLFGSKQPSSKTRRNKIDCHT
jgi:hypothetical protein